jgi:hypothetical protein
LSGLKTVLTSLGRECVDPVHVWFHGVDQPRGEK